MMQLFRITRPVAVLAMIAAFGMSACQKEQQSQSADSTARDLTLAPAESTAAMRDMPEHQPPAQPQPPRTQPPVRRSATPPAPPAAARPNTPARATLRLTPGARFDMAASDSISSRTAKPGDPFTARVVEDVKTASGDVIIPAGSVVNGTISDVKPAPNPRTR